MRLPALYFGVATALTIVAPRYAEAQTRNDLRIEAGVAQIVQPSSDDRVAATLGIIRHRGDPTLAWIASGNATWARDSVAAAQLAIGAAWRPSPASKWQLEAAGAGVLFALTDPFRDASASAGARARWLRWSSLSASAGAAAGRTVRSAGTAASRQMDLGISVAAGSAAIDLAVRDVGSTDGLLLEASQVTTRDGSREFDLRDFVASVAFERGPIELSLVETIRRGRASTIAEQAAFMAAATWHVTARYALVVTSGRQLADPVRGAPDATVTQIAVRRSVTSLDNEVAPRASEASVSVTRVGEQRIVVLRVAVPAATRVEVAGNFSGWEPVEGERRDGAWEARIPLGPGRYRIAYRLDGGPWLAPAGLARLREFSGEVGLLVVP
ncbi:MAG: hypothetical protein FJ202_00460 [Gemmatimonadetes bacterium]|nr:hypothetical protein [Gemmatimonadota bacterium]